MINGPAQGTDSHEGTVRGDVSARTSASPTTSPTSVPLEQAPVLILGAGINGAAIARELAINGVSVCLVDTADVAFGATAYASRLIHGGLRYLEYGEFDLVRESLAERSRLLRLAPQFVRPLRLFIPIENRFGGLWRSAQRFLFKGQRGKRPPQRGKPTVSRGLWLVQMGLRLYDAYARDPQLPRHATHRAAAEDAIKVDPRYRWLCSYYDAQIRFPERFVLAMLADAQQAATAAGSTCQVFTRHRAALDGRMARIYPRDSDQPVRSFEPVAVINATGAWVDLTLARLGLQSQRLMGGTKGTHIVTWNERLHDALTHHGQSYAGLYAEAADGRPVFVLPFGDASLIGTTDDAYEGNPSDAVATGEEIDYLLATANELLPQIRLTDKDVDLHYSGVRPLPYVGGATPAGVTRRHSLIENHAAPMPFFSIIGGKLTTCRSLAEETVALVLGRLGQSVVATSEARPIPGATGYSTDPREQEACCQEIATRLGLAPAQVHTTWQLYGTRCETVLGACADDKESLPGTDLPTAAVRYAVRHEWVHTLDDLVERRLMLLYHRRLYEGALRRTAEILAEEAIIAKQDVASQIEQCRERLRVHFGKQVFPGSP
ncbi:MAG TPA: glycerol-3-phosphate dehydrogenase/oxidase [Pirellulales bacterium]|jgi:glycerol-3-phosphate dehydrogenase